MLLILASGAAADPVFPPALGKEAADGLRTKLEPVLRLSEAELLRLIPERSGITNVACPACDGGALEEEISWSIDRPHEVFCRFCKTRFPNEQYPEDKILRVKNPRGEIQEYPYWEAPTPPPVPRQGTNDAKEGYRHFFTARGWHLAKEYLANAALELAQLYWLTGERPYARRSALILDRFAQVYPGYCARNNYPFRQKIIYPGEQGFPFPFQDDYRAAKWAYWAYGDIPDNLVRTYDLIRDSGELDPAARRRIEGDLIRASVAFVRSYREELSNMDPAILRGLITAGRVLGDPGYVHDAVAWIERLVRRQFFVDGMWREGAVSYHNQTLHWTMVLMDLLKGYSDPPGYVPPGGGERFENLDLAGRLPLLEKARRIPELLRYPNGRVVAFHDTWARERIAATGATGPLLLRGMGHARLGRGRGAHQMQAHLHYGGGYGHDHFDLLSLTLFAHGQERLSDIGYTNTSHRHWATCTLSHNTVMVDGKDQVRGSERQPNDGDLRLYVPGDETLQVVEAAGERAYPGVTSVYRRLLALVGVGDEDAYVVDLFRVAGGARHEYVLVGDADHGGTLETALPRTAHGASLLPPEVTVRFPKGGVVPGDAGGHNIAYAYFRDVERAVPTGSWTATFAGTEAAPGGVKVHGLAEEGTELLFGRVPSVRAAEENEARVGQYTMPALIRRREGTALASQFVTVLEPFAERPFLRRVERLPLTGGRSGDVALKITWGDRADYLFVAGEEGGGTLRAGGVELRGRLGFLRERNGVVERMTLVGGTLLQKGSRRLRGEGILWGRIVDVLRKEAGDEADALVVDQPLPAGYRLKGLTVIVRDGAGFAVGHEVAGVATRDGRTRLLLADDPGFEIAADGTSRHCYFPGRSWQGENRFEIATVAQEGNATR